jgi:hypothetical protein
LAQGVISEDDRDRKAVLGFLPSLRVLVNDGVRQLIARPPPVDVDTEFVFTLTFGVLQRRTAKICTFRGKKLRLIKFHGGVAAIALGASIAQAGGGAAPV